AIEDVSPAEADDVIAQGVTRECFAASRSDEALHEPRNLLVAVHRTALLLNDDQVLVRVGFPANKRQLRAATKAKYEVIARDVEPCIGAGQLQAPQFNDIGSAMTEETVHPVACTQNDAVRPGAAV